MNFFNGVKKIKTVVTTLICASLLQFSAPALAANSCPDMFLDNNSKNQIVNTNPFFLKNLIPSKQRILRYTKENTVDHVVDWAKLPFTQKINYFFRTQVLRSLKIAGDLLIVAPVPIFDRKARILNKQTFNPDYIPRGDEKIYLEKNFYSLEQFKERGLFLKRHPYWNNLKKGFKTARAVLASLAITLVASQSFSMEKNAQSFEKYISQTRVESQQEKQVVQLLVETTPFPHAAIRIGDTVYSYGTEHMTRSTVYQYMSVSDAPNALNLKMNEKSGLAGMTDRSVRTVTLNLSTREVNEIRRELELSTGKRYKNITGINDCATMIARALRKHSSVQLPIAVDPSPTTLLSYLSLLHMAGDSRVGEVQMVVSNTDKANLFLVRNTYIGLQEANILVGALPLSLSGRVYFDLTHTEKEIEFYDAETLQQINQWKQDVNTEIEGNLQLFGQTDQIQDADPTNLQSLIELVIDPELAQAQDVLNSPTTDFKNIILAQQKTSYLTAKKAQYLKIIRSSP